MSTPECAPDDAPAWAADHAAMARRSVAVSAGLPSIARDTARACSGEASRSRKALARLRMSEESSGVRRDDACARGKGAAPPRPSRPAAAAAVEEEEGPGASNW